MGVSKSDVIIIVGGGAFGLSTALHLAKKGYTNISVYEKDDHIPPRSSAANDLNKIVRAEYEDPFYTELTIKAIAAWKTPLFAPHFHQTGFLHCVSGDAPDQAVDTLQRFRNSAEHNAQIKPHVIPLNNEADIRQVCWQLDGPLSGWKGYFNRFDGYAHSANALAAVYRATQAAGVRFFLGEQGAVDEIVYVSTLKGRKCAGIRTKNGRFHPAALTIVAAGAGAGRLVPQLGQQVVAKSWSVAHVHLTDEETSALRGIPVTYARDLGFLFEPDPKTNLLKLCPMGGGYINTDPKTGVSHAPLSLEESAFVPEEDEKQMRKLLAHTFPSLADRPLVKKSLCWFADTNDSDFIVDYIPNMESSVILMSGDSGHGFKMFPIVGSFITDLLEAPDNKQPVSRWRWKHPNPAAGKAADWGGEVSWRLGQSKELSSILPSRASKL
ncbi:FAD dependent oxidoreductase [Penicillium macrosclerotiorum]|uniref:FAD dependent oxidoreductase n=1 Tax=Penicillium macrosclerotiorum TaxID=303699 RepID=UPI002546F357|nr:FAD dependent oxidoreductase [Penicillium macrosclerotiorum]KAJ5699072.1 FAD dependent oxidoreductase [Penicillium macrosclerotiorum]